MAEEKPKTEEKPQEKVETAESSAPVWMIAATAVVGIILIFATMYFLLNHVRETYVIPFYQMRYILEQRADSLSTAVEAGIPPELIEEAQVFRERSDSLSQVTVEQHEQIGELEERVEDIKQEQLELSTNEVKQLAGIFGTMKADRAASIMVNLDRETIIQVLMSINQRDAAKIMAAMPTDKAAGIARQIQNRAEQRATAGGGR